MNALQDRLKQLDALDARLDAARRRAAAPGQLGLDLGGGAKGNGQPCGEGHISSRYTCRKGSVLPEALEKGLKQWTPPGYLSSHAAANDPGVKRGSEIYSRKGEKAGFEFYRNYQSEISLSSAEQDRLYGALEADGWKVFTYAHGLSKGKRRAERERALPQGRGMVHEQVVFEGDKVRLLRAHQFKSAAMPYLAKDVEPVGELISPGGETTKTFYRVKGTAGQDQRIVTRTRTPQSGFQGVAELEGPAAATKAWEVAQRETVERYQFGQNITTTRTPGMKVRKPLTLDSLAKRLDAIEQAGRGDRLRTLDDIIREEREEAWKRVKRSRGGYMPTKEQLIREEREAALRKSKGRRKGKPCGEGWIRPEFECRRDWAELQERLERLDARVRQAPGQLGLDLSSSGSSTGPGVGEKCGASWISRDKTCHKGAGTAGGEQPSRFMRLAQSTQDRKAREAAERQQQQAQAAASAGNGPKIGLPDLSDEKTAPLLDGRPPQKGLGGGAYGDTYLYRQKDGSQLVVKVDRLQNLDPMDTGYGKDQEAQRWDMVHRERAAMARANELGLGPKPIGEVQKLPDGRLAFAYEYVEGVKLWKDHREARMTQEAFDLMQQPGMRARVAAEVGRIGRTMAESGFEHGDAHGGNLLLGKDGRVTLIDWGYSNQVKADSPVAKAEIELRTAAILGEQLGVTGPIDMRAGRGGVKDRISGSGPILHFQGLTSAARKAGDLVIRDYESAWNRDPANTLADPGEALTKANRLKKELGITFREAEGMVGLEAPITPEIKARAAAARDAVFGERQLKLMRRMLDTHYQAWNNYAPWEVAA